MRDNGGGKKKELLGIHTYTFIDWNEGKSSAGPPEGAKG